MWYLPEAIYIETAAEIKSAHTSREHAFQQECSAWCVGSAAYSSELGVSLDRDAPTLCRLYLDLLLDGRHEFGSRRLGRRRVVQRVSLRVPPCVVPPLVSRANDRRVDVADAPLLLAEQQAIQTEASGLPDDMSVLLRINVKLARETGLPCCRMLESSLRRAHLTRCCLGADDPSLLVRRVRAVVLDPVLVSNSPLQDGVEPVEVNGKVHLSPPSGSSRSAVTQRIDETYTVNEQTRPFKLHVMQSWRVALIDWYLAFAKPRRALHDSTGAVSATEYRVRVLSCTSLPSSSRRSVSRTRRNDTRVGDGDCGRIYNPDASHNNRIGR